MVGKPRTDSEETNGVESLRSTEPPSTGSRATAFLRPNLEEPLTVLRLHKRSILAIVLLSVVAGLFVSIRQTRIYEAQAKILVSPDVANQAPNLATEAQLVSSVAVAQLVAENLDISGAPAKLLANLRVDRPIDTDILEVSYRDADPLTAQRRAQGFAEAYLEYRREGLTEQQQDSVQAIQDQLSALQQRIDQTEQTLESIALDDPSRAALESRVTILQEAIAQGKLDELALTDLGTIGTIFQEAALPTSPINPKHVVTVTLGLVAGLALGIGLAFSRDRLSGRVRSVDEIEEHLEAPVLGSIPRMSKWRNSKEPVAITLTDWRSSSAEAYRMLRTSVLSTASSYGAKSIVVTSLYRGEGRSATVANLGVVLAMAGKKVSLVSADLRQPRLHEFFGCEGRYGLTEVLAQERRLDKVLQGITLATLPWSHVSRIGLRILPSGRVPEDPPELLTSDRMSGVLRELEEISDIVLIDTPPLLPVSDALVVASVADAVILVIGPESFDRSSLISARQQLDLVVSHTLGGVLNNLAPSAAPAISAR